MLFRYKISTPANTAETAKQKTTLKVAYGIVTQIDVQFPPGPVGLLHLHINNALHQVWPFNTGEDFASHNVNITFRDFIPVLVDPYEFQAYTWNTDDTLAHLLIIRIGILPVNVAAPWLMSLDDKLKTIIGGP